MPHATEQAKASRWLAEIEGELMDIVAIRDQFPESPESVVEIDGKHFLISPDIDACASASDARRVAVDTIDALNMCAGLIYPDHMDIRLGAIAEWNHEILTRHYSARLEPGIYRLRMADVKLTAGSKEGAIKDLSDRSIADQALEHMRSNPSVREAMSRLHNRQADWPDLYIVFDVVKRLSTPSGAKATHKEILSLGWATEDELERLYDTANFYRHGPPRKPTKYPEMTIEDGRDLVRRLMLRLLKELK